MIIYHTGKIDMHAVTREQLELLLTSSAPEWKGYFQNGLSVILTCIINILALGVDTNSASFSLNIGLGLLACIICALSFCMKCREDNKQATRLSEILNQPVQELKVYEEQLNSQL